MGLTRLRFESKPKKCYNSGTEVVEIQLFFYIYIQPHQRAVFFLVTVLSLLRDTDVQPSDPPRGDEDSHDA